MTQSSPDNVPNMFDGPKNGKSDYYLAEEVVLPIAEVMEEYRALSSCQQIPDRCYSKKINIATND